jgi:ribonuclease P protein component
MNRRHRLTKRTDFQRVRREGRSYAHPLAILIIAPNEISRPRFGFIAGKGVGNAVKRNRSKRRLREVIRNHLPQISPGWDMLIIARPSTADAEWKRLTEAMEDLLRRAGVLSR